MCDSSESKSSDNAPRDSTAADTTIGGPPAGAETSGVSEGTEAAEAGMPPPGLGTVIRFGPHVVTSQVFHRTPYTFCIVNISPLLPGHVLACPLRRVPHLCDLSPPEASDLIAVVQRVGQVLKRVYAASALNVAVQDGRAAGQSVAHVHAHLIPRREGDMEERGGGDRLYEELEGVEGDVGGALRGRDGLVGEGEGKWRGKQGERKIRSMAEMEEEARWLAEEVRKDLGG